MLPVDSDGASPPKPRPRPTSSAMSCTRGRSRRALSAATSASDDDGGAYTTSLADWSMGTPIERIHRTLEAPAASTCLKGLRTDIPAPLEEDEEKEISVNATSPQNSHAASSPSSSGSIRRRRRRLASPHSVLVEAGTAHYVTSPWATELDEEDTDDEYYVVKPSSGKGRLTKLRRLASCPRDEVIVAEHDDDFYGVGQREGLRRRRRSRRRRVTLASSSSSLSSLNSKEGKAAPKNSEREKIEEAKSALSFTAFRVTYLIVHIAIMLADGLQGTHLYVLYEGYGYSVASLYCLGFVSGALTSPFIGPLVDKIGRKKSAVLYCALEIFINLLEQNPVFAGLIASRVVSGVTTNLLFSVFESWLVTEHRRRGYAQEKLETILRDSAIASNLAAIASGWLAHWLAGLFGPVGPFEGAVTCTAMALVLVSCLWTENYGSVTTGQLQSMRQYMSGALHTIVSESKIFRIGIIQGFSEGALQTFVFLWSPALRHFAVHAPKTTLGLDTVGEPAYGLIFGAFMACGVLGGLAEPYVRRVVTLLVCDIERPAGIDCRDTVVSESPTRANASSDGGDNDEVKPAAVEFLTAMVYFSSACLLIVPVLLPSNSPFSFTVALGSFLAYEIMIGLYMPCEGVIRSIYMPTASICSIMTMLRVIVNVCVALGVVSTKYIPFTTAFAVIGTLMLISATIQISLVSPREWSNFVSRIKAAPRDSIKLRLSSALASSSCLPPATEGKGKKGDEGDDGRDVYFSPLEFTSLSSLMHVEETSSSSEDEDDVAYYG